MAIAELFSADLLLDPFEIFGRNAALEVDLGCGDGSFLAEMASRNPERDFLGIERLLGRVRSTRWKIESRELTNARVLRGETRHAVQHLLPRASVQAFHLLFPDPWPKRRHQSRRIVTSDFLSTIAGALADDGILHFATDQRDYFDASNHIASSLGTFTMEEADTDSFPVTTFERHFRAKGIPIYRALMRKISPVTNARASHPESRNASSTAPVSS